MLLIGRNKSKEQKRGATGNKYQDSKLKANIIKTELSLMQMG